PTTPEVPNYRPEVSLYTAVPSMALMYSRAMLDTLHERVGAQVAEQLGALGQRFEAGAAQIAQQAEAAAQAQAEALAEQRRAAN
ncbi:hypothetical protein ABTK93_20615, partial [Acinetobacter baumannii]